MKKYVLGESKQMKHVLFAETQNGTVHDGD